MTGPSYDKATALAILGMAYPEWNYPPYVVRDDGIYQSEDHRAISPPGRVFDWTFAYDMSWPGSPNPITAPMLPIPFSPHQLAAFMLDGVGSGVQDVVGWRLGYPINADDTISLGDRYQWVAQALREAYIAAADAQTRVGEFNYEAQARAYALDDQYDDASDVANKREGVFEPGIDQEESRRRRARAADSVADLKQRARNAVAESDARWKTWRKAMVRELLADSTSIERNPENSPSTSDDGDDKKRWTAAKLAELAAYRDKYGTKAAASHYGVSKQRVRGLLPTIKAKSAGYSVFTHRAE